MLSLCRLQLMLHLKTHPTRLRHLLLQLPQLSLCQLLLLAQFTCFTLCCHYISHESAVLLLCRLQLGLCVVKLALQAVNLLLGAVGLLPTCGKLQLQISCGSFSYSSLLCQSGSVGNFLLSFFALQLFHMHVLGLHDQITSCASSWSPQSSAYLI